MLSAFIGIGIKWMGNRNAMPINIIYSVFPFCPQLGVLLEFTAYHIVRIRNNKIVNWGGFFCWIYVEDVGSSIREIDFHLICRILLQSSSRQAVFGGSKREIDTCKYSFWQIQHEMDIRFFYHKFIVPSIYQIIIIINTLSFS